MLSELTRRLAGRASEVDLTGTWPADSVKILDEFGCRRWMIPRSLGGDALGPLEMMRGYEAIARGCMSTILIFTQHDAAVDLIVTGDNDELKERLCPALSDGTLLLTVGLSQLTTSHQGGKPAMAVDWDGRQASFTGLMPWVTSATQADMIVTGGVLPDGMQISACVAADSAGLSFGEPMKLAALNATMTASVHCEQTVVDARNVIRGPVGKVMSVRGTVRPMVVSSAGLGLAGAIVDELKSLVGRRSRELAACAESIFEHYERVREKAYAAAGELSGGGVDDDKKSEMRVAVNDLLVRASTTLMTLAKGTGYLNSRPAQRMVREAMFFLVWSIPDSVQVRTLHALWD